MNFHDYNIAALRTETVPEKLNIGNGDLDILLNFLVSAAKIADCAKKVIAYGKQPDFLKLMPHVIKASSALTILSATGIAQSASTFEDEQLHEVNMRVLHGAIGMFGEAGELLQAVHNQLNTGELDMVNVAEEIGDMQWYAAITADECDVRMNTILDTNIAKLTKRYPEKFSLEQSENRDLASERKVLEGV
jgi:NTP pyrophosphatase (non-canonical NTP hydrolase)